MRVSLACYRDGRDSVALHGDTIARDMLEPTHVAGLWRVAPTDTTPDVAPLAALGRSLDAYADAIGGAQ